MEVKDALILDASEPLSKALNEILKQGTAVIVLKNRSYFGIIDDRTINLGISDTSKARCETFCVRTPVLYPQSTLIDRLNAFMAGHFKALPVVDEIKSLPLGLITRVEVLKELLSLKLIPKKVLSEVMNAPVYTIDLNSTLADAKSKIKAYGAHRLLVLNKGYPYGILSTFDLAGLLSNPQDRKGDRMISEIQNIN